MRRILGTYVFKVYPDRTLGEIISRIAEIEAMSDVQMSFDAACDLDLEQEALEMEIERILANNEAYTRH